MPRMINPFCSPRGSVYHICSDCNLRNIIPRHHKRKGTGGRKLRKRCRDLKDRKRERINILRLPGPDGSDNMVVNGLTITYEEYSLVGERITRNVSIK